MSEKDVKISISRRYMDKFWPWVVAGLLGVGGWQTHALSGGEPRDSVKVAVLESQMKDVQETLHRIENKLDNLDRK